MKTKYGCAEDLIADYTCCRTKHPPRIDGHLDEAVWQAAPKSPRFVDMVTGEPAFLDTRAAALWDNDCLYIAFWIDEPNVRADLTERDSPVYLENDVEVFIDGDDCYYEFQINARGTIYEVLYIWQEAYKKGSRFNREEFDLMTRQVDVLGGFQDTLRRNRHPRGRRWAFLDWDFPGLKAAVEVEGTLNDSSDIDRGWTVEAAFPWSGMDVLAGGRALPPREGDVWRMDFSRFEKLNYNGVEAEPHPGWSLNPHGVYDSHIPECFTRVHFSREEVP